MATLTKIAVTCSKKFVEVTKEDGKKTKELQTCPKVEGVVEYQMPESLDEAKALFGEKETLGLVVSKATIFVQDTWRRLVANGEDPALATTKAMIAKPGLAAPRVAQPDAEDVMLKRMQTMDPVARKKYIQELLAKANTLA